MSVGVFNTEVEAEIAKGALDAFGIECYLGPAAQNYLPAVVVGQVGSFDLMVRAEDADRARDVLADNETPPSGYAR